jgi:hypothetical protein
MRAKRPAKKTVAAIASSQHNDRPRSVTRSFPKALVPRVGREPGSLFIVNTLRLNASWRHCVLSVHLGLLGLCDCFLLRSDRFHSHGGGDMACHDGVLRRLAGSPLASVLMYAKHCNERRAREH